MHTLHRRSQNLQTIDVDAAIIKPGLLEAATKLSIVIIVSLNKPCNVMAEVVSCWTRAEPVLGPLLHQNPLSGMCWLPVEGAWFALPGMGPVLEL